MNGYQTEGVRWFPKGQAGAQPIFRDSEVMTVLLLMDFLPFPGETQFLTFLRAHHLDLFPRLLSQSQFNRRARRRGLLQRWWDLAAEGPKGP